MFYIDETVIAGLIVVAGTLGFFGGVAWFIWQDNKKAIVKRQQPLK